MNKYQKDIEKLFHTAGVRINGPGRYDIQVHNQKFYKRVMRDGSLGLGESYMEGWWDCDAVDELITRLLKAELEKKVKGNVGMVWRTFLSRY